MIAGLLRVKIPGRGMSQMGELSALPDVSHSAAGARAGTLRPEGGIDDDADRIYRRVSRADHHKWEPEWTILTQQSRFRVSRPRPRRTAQLPASSVVPLPACCSGAGGTYTRLKCRDWSGISMKCFGDSGTRDAEDAAHNAFVELFTNWDTVRSPRAWLRKVAFRQMLRQNARAEYPLDVLREEPATVPASDAAGAARGNAGNTALAAATSAGTAASARPDLRRVLLRRDRADHGHERSRRTEKRGKSQTQDERTTGITDTGRFPGSDLGSRQ